MRLESIVLLAWIAVSATVPTAAVAQVHHPR